MLRCDYCNEIIVEPSDEELKAQLDDADELEDQSDGTEGDGSRRRRKKKKPATSAPTKRPSLITLPYQRSVNGYDDKAFDLCPECLDKLNKLVDHVRFKFASKMHCKSFFIVPECKWEEGVVIDAADEKLAIRQYKDEACVNVDVDVYRVLDGCYQFLGHYVLEGEADANT